MELGDYAQALGAAQRLIPAWDEPERRRAELQQQQAQTKLMQQQVAASQQQQQDGQAFQSALGTLPQNPTAQQYRQLATKFPRFFKPISEVADGMDAQHKTQTISHLSQIGAAIAANKPDLAVSQIQRHIDADKAAGNQPDEEDMALVKMLQSGDPQQVKAAGVLVHGTLAGLDPATAKAFADGGNDTHVINPGGALVDNAGKELYRAAPAEDNAIQVPVYDDQGHRIGTKLVPNGGKGGDPASSGGAAGARGDVSRLINTDAGGGYVPEGVKTLGQFVAFGKGLNNRGAKSSSAGTYQINGSTMAEFAPQALGKGWQNAPYTAESQEKVGEAIFNWAKQQPDPAKALRGRWVSLDAKTAAGLVQGSWQQARGTIAAGETGGAAGASASRQGGDDGMTVGPVATKDTGTGDPNTTGNAYLASLTPGRRNLITAIAEGRAPAPRPGSKFGEQLSEDLARAYPDVDTTQFAGRQQAVKAFTTGKEGNTVRSLNVAIDHLGVLHDAAIALNSGNIPLFNKLNQRWQRATGSPLPQNATAVAGIVGDEVTKAVIGSAGALADRQELKHTLDTAGSPAQIAGITRQYISLMAGQAKGLQLQYEQSTGKKDFVRFLSPTTAKQLGLKHGQESSATPAKAPTGGKMIGTYQGKAVYQLPDGRRVVAR